MRNKSIRIALLGVAAVLSVVEATHAANYEIDFKLNTAATYEALQFNVAYGSTSGQLVGSGAAVSCTPNTSIGMLASFNDVDATKTLTPGFISTSGIPGPAVLCTCIYSGSSAPTANQFSVTIVDFIPGSTPSVSVSRIQLTN